MFRDTMIRTIPVAMIATADDCTDRFQRFRDEEQAARQDVRRPR